MYIGTLSWYMDLSTDVPAACIGETVFEHRNISVFPLMLWQHNLKQTTELLCVVLEENMGYELANSTSSDLAV